MHIINTWTSQIIRTFVQTGESHTTPGVRPDVRPDVRAARVSTAAPKKKSFDRGGPVWPPRSNVTNDRLRGDPSLDLGLPSPPCLIALRPHFSKKILDNLRYSILYRFLWILTSILEVFLDPKLMFSKSSCCLIFNFNLRSEVQKS